MSSERTEKASPRRRQKAQQEGDRPRSREVLSAAALLAGSLTLGWSARAWLPIWTGIYQDTMALMLRPSLSSDSLSLSMRNLLVAGAAPCLFVMLAAAGASLAIAMVQNRGLRLQPAGIAPKWSRLNPAQNAKHLFTTRALVRLGKSLIPVLVLAIQLVHFVVALHAMPVFSLARLPQVFGEGYELLVNTAWIMLVWSLVDYIVEWRQWESRLKMSKQELREEFKETEGNPQMKGRIRSLQRQMRRRMLRADVKKASVVITNPTHYAVALSFDINTMEAPKVLAKGRDLLAAQIKEEARWAGVPVVENPPLARSLYRSVEPGQSIPAELYAAVAAILAYLFRQEAEERMRREHQQRQRNVARAQAAPSNGIVSPMSLAGRSHGVATNKETR
jgi:flagellar biosynthesis protein FlhB